MKKTLKSILLIVIILFLIAFTFIKNQEVKRLVMLNEGLNNRWNETRKECDLTIEAYKDTLRVIRGHKKE